MADLEYMKKIKPVGNCPNEARYKQPGVEYPTVQKVTYFSKYSQKDHQMNVFLPLGYTKDKKYPVLYLLHDFIGNQDSYLENVGSDTIPTVLFKEGKAKEMIVVLPNEYTTEPSKEYPPQPNKVFESFSPLAVEAFDSFIHEIVECIMPYMEEHYSIATGRENTAICGYSMGARNCLYIGYKRSDLFGYIGAFSPAPGVTPGDDAFGHHPGLLSEDEFRADPQPIVTFITCSEHDEFVGKFPIGYHEILKRNKNESIYYEIKGIGHGDDAIAISLYNFVQIVFGALNK